MSDIGLAVLACCLFWVNVVIFTLRCLGAM